MKLYAGWDWIKRTITGDWDRASNTYYILDELPPVPLDDIEEDEHDDDEWHAAIASDYPR